MKRRTVVYMAVPMRQGHWTDNVRMSLAAYDDLIRKGYAPICPILSWFADMVHPRSFEEWLDYDYGLINVSDCVVRLPGSSEGADLEMDYAVRHEKPVFVGTLDLYAGMSAEIETAEVV